MANSETVYTSQQAAHELGITQQMLSKYTQVYLKLSGDKILKQGRNGRRYSEAQFKMIQNARNWVQSNTGVTVEDAMKRAVAFSDSPLEVIDSIEARNDTETLLKALRSEVAAPIVEELQALRAEVAELKNRGALEVPSSEVTYEGKHYSPLQRFFRRWLGME